MAEAGLTQASISVGRPARRAVSDSRTRGSDGDRLHAADLVGRPQVERLHHRAQVGAQAVREVVPLLAAHHPDGGRRRGDDGENGERGRDRGPSTGALLLRHSAGLLRRSAPDAAALHYTPGVSAADPDARARSLAPIVAAALVAQQVASNAGRDALFLTHFDVTTLPWFVAAAAALSLPAAIASGRLLARLGPVRVVPWLLASSGALFLLEWGLLAPLPRATATILYLHSAILGGIAISAWWSLLNERFDPHSAKPLMAKVAGAATLGGLLGGLGAERTAPWPRRAPFWPGSGRSPPWPRQAPSPSGTGLPSGRAARRRETASRRSR